MTMPELPELDVIAEILTGRLAGLTVRRAVVHSHLVVYGVLPDILERRLTGRTIRHFRADGKFVIMETDSGFLVVNPMLTGRFRLTRHTHTPRPSDMLSLELDDANLWYTDRKRMGRVYFVESGDFSAVAGWDGRGPSAMDPELTLETFRSRIQHYNGQIKSVLRNQRFVKGIGNAYADEILLYAGILPFRSRSSLSSEDVERLYTAVRSVLGRYRALLAKRGLDKIGAEERDFLMIHGKGGSICPLCGGRVSEVSSNRSKTSYCQTCQR
ncbi:MAG: hypothetical protein HXY34_04150 [Candidatus Thorarchaeota archaeon]|nr:hypothetical protein [Candidatus Thorarchaeota archaeon]